MPHSHLAWLTVLSATLAGCVLPTTPSPPELSNAPSAALPEAGSTVTLHPIRIAISTYGEGFTYLFVPQALGIFEQYGLAVELPVLGGNAAVAALLAGEVDFLASAGTAIRAAERGMPVRIVLIALNRTAHLLLVGDKTIAGVSELRGKTLAGAGPQNTTNVVLAELLRRRGLEPGQYEVLNVGDSAPRMASVVNGFAAATVLDATTTLQMVKEGYTVLARGDEIELPNGGLATSLSALQEKRDVVRQVARAVLTGVEVTRTQRERVLPIMQNQFGFSAEEAAQVYEWLHAGWTPDGKPSPASMQFGFEVDQRDLQLPEIPAIDQVYDFSVLQELFSTTK